MIVEGIHQGKATALGFASGILAGLVAVTPAAGVVQPYGAIILEIATAGFCYLAISLKNKLGYDDTLDAFGIHGIGGIIGAILLTFFIRKSWMQNAAELAGGSWTIWQQFGVQIIAVLIAIFYAAIITLIITFVLDKIIGFRASSEYEMQGLDLSYHAESEYGMVNLG
jgi:Amt family ammonium transporter